MVQCLGDVGRFLVWESSAPMPRVWATVPRVSPARWWLERSGTKIRAVDPARSLEIIMVGKTAAIAEEESTALISNDDTQKQQQHSSSSCSNTTVAASSYGSSSATSAHHHHHHQAEHHNKTGRITRTFMEEEEEEEAYSPTTKNYHHHHHQHHQTSTSGNDEDGSLSTTHNPMSTTEQPQQQQQLEFTLFGRYYCCTLQIPSTRRLAISLSLYLNIAITVAKLVAYIRTLSLSVLAALLDSVLDVVSQVVLNYTEQHSSLQRSSAFYPAGASRLEPIGVLTCAALMGMASFEVIKESITALLFHSDFEIQAHLSSVYAMIAIVIIKMMLLWLCHVGAYKRPHRTSVYHHNHPSKETATTETTTTTPQTMRVVDEEDASSTAAVGAASVIREGAVPETPQQHQKPNASATQQQQWADPTMEALAQDHWNDTLSNGVAAVALVLAVHDQRLWFLDPIGAMLISLYIIYSWYMTGKEQIEHLTGKSAPGDFIGELVDMANEFDDRIVVDTVRAYHFGPKFLVEIEIVMDQSTLLYESHDLGMDLQYAIEGREEVERCFVHIDYQARPYDEHVVSKVPELREKYVKGASTRTFRSAQSV